MLTQLHCNLEAIAESQVFMSYVRCVHGPLCFLSSPYTQIVLCLTQHCLLGIRVLIKINNGSIQLVIIP